MQVVMCIYLIPSFEIFELLAYLSLDSKLKVVFQLRFAVKQTTPTLSGLK